MLWLEDLLRSLGDVLKLQPKDGVSRPAQQPSVRLDT